MILVVVVIVLTGSGYSAIEVLVPLMLVSAAPLLVLAPLALLASRHCASPTRAHCCFRHGRVTPLRPRCAPHGALVPHGALLVRPAMLEFARDFGWPEGTRATVSGCTVRWAGRRSEPLPEQPIATVRASAPSLPLLVFCSTPRQLYARARELRGRRPSSQNKTRLGTYRAHS